MNTQESKNREESQDQNQAETPKLNKPEVDTEKDFVDLYQSEVACW